MSLQGLPDLYQPIQAEGFQIFYPYENAGDFVILPQALQVAKDNQGNPDFALTLVRGQNPDLPPKPYGLLDFRLEPDYAIEAAIATVRQRSPQAQVQPVVFSAGFLRFYPTAATEALPEDLKAPIPLVWNGLSQARYQLQLSNSTAVQLKGALLSNILLLTAQAEMEFAGVADRIPVRVRFDPAILLEKLAALGNAQRQVACEDILNFFRQDRQQLPLEIIGEIASVDRFAATMLDWVRAQFGSFIPSPTADGKPFIALAAAASSRSEWDLSQPCQTYRTIILSLHPLEAAHQLAQQQGIEAVFRETVVPPIPTGTFAIDITANLPSYRPNLLSLGVTLRAAPVLPYRSQARIVSAELMPPTDRASVLLRLSPIEKLNYTFATYVILQDNQGVQELRAAEIASTKERLFIRPDQFPVNFIAVDAARSLLDLATVEGICRWHKGEATFTQTFELNQQHPAIALALPKEAIDATLEIQARCLESHSILQLPPYAARNYQLGLYSFREYGSHEIEIECEFNDSTSLYAIDVLPEGRPESEASPIFFTPDQPRKRWNWLATSPFRAGYRYRIHPLTDQRSPEWSTVQSPFVPLKVQTHPSRG